MALMKLLSQFVLEVIYVWRVLWIAQKLLDDHIVVCLFVASFVSAILHGSFFSSKTHKSDYTNLLRIPITMAKTREKITNEIL